MRTPLEALHTLVALALCAPILVFYLVIASEMFGQPTEHYMLVSTTSFAQICSALAKEPRQ
jgi:hypothetical protein